MNEKIKIDAEDLTIKVNTMVALAKKGNAQLQDFGGSKNYLATYEDRSYVLRDTPDRYDLILPWKYEVKRNER